MLVRHTNRPDAGPAVAQGPHPVNVKGPTAPSRTLVELSQVEEGAHGIRFRGDRDKQCVSKEHMSYDRYARCYFNKDLVFLYSINDCTIMQLAYVWFRQIPGKLSMSPMAASLTGVAAPVASMGVHGADVGTGTGCGGLARKPNGPHVRKCKPPARGKAGLCVEAATRCVRGFARRGRFRPEFGKQQAL